MVLGVPCERVVRPPGPLVWRMCIWVLNVSWGVSTSVVMIGIGIVGNEALAPVSECHGQAGGRVCSVLAEPAGQRPGRACPQGGGFGSLSLLSGEVGRAST